MCELDYLTPEQYEEVFAELEIPQTTLDHILLDVHETLRRLVRLEQKLGELEAEFAPLARKASGALAAASRLPGVGMGRRRGGSA